MDLFKLPRELGEYQGEKVSANIGRFGPYVKYKSVFASIKAAEGDDPMTIELDRAIELIEAKIEADKNKYIKVFDEAKPVIEVLNGRYGPYLKSGRKNYKLPKDIEDPAKISREEAEAIIADSAKKPAKGRAKKSTKK